MQRSLTSLGLLTPVVKVREQDAAHLFNTTELHKYIRY